MLIEFTFENYENKPEADMTEQSIEQTDEIRRRLLIFFQNDQSLVDQYIQEYGPVIQMKAIQCIREKLQAIVEEDPNLEVPTYSITLECPCCRTKDIVHRELRASAMSVRNDPFLAPVYFPVGKFKALNYLTVSVAVCPKCYFASPDKKDFIQFNKSSKQTVPSRLTIGVIAELQDSMAERMEMVDRARCGKDFQAQVRAIPLAILSYRLAEQRARIEQEGKIPFAILKRASYQVRIALLLRQSGEDDSSALERALALYKDAYYRTDFPNPNTEFQSCFIIFSVHLKFGQLKEARDYVTAMEQSKKRIEELNDSSALQSLNQWLGMTKARWDDRENPHLWDTPTK